MSFDNMIRTAIANKQIVRFYYHGYERIAEPHIYGRKSGKIQVLFYQIGGGSSSGGLPNWRRMEVDEMSGFQTTDKNFPGPRPYPSGEHSDWDEIFAVVK